LEYFLFFQSLVNGLVIATVIILVALGLNLVFGIMNIVNLAHGELYMLGAYFLWWAGVQHSIPYLPSFIFSVFAIALFGVLLEKMFFKSLRGHLISGLLVAIGLILSLQSGALLFFGEQPRGVPAPIILKGVLRMFGLVISKERLAVILITMSCIILMYIFIHRSRIGKAIQAVAQDPDAAALQGISIDNISSLVMGLSAAMAAIAGCLMGTINPITATVGQQPLLEALVVIVLGGLGSIPGTIVGGLIVGLTKGFMGSYITTTVASITVYLILFILLILKPSGLFGRD
jgi:branched-chain amino acid transport system permease protein